MLSMCYYFKGGQALENGMAMLWWCQECHHHGFCVSGPCGLQEWWTGGLLHSRWGLPGQILHEVRNPRRIIVWSHRRWCDDEGSPRHWLLSISFEMSWRNMCAMHSVNWRGLRWQNVSRTLPTSLLRGDVYPSPSIQQIEHLYATRHWHWGSCGAPSAEVTLIMLFNGWYWGKATNVTAGIPWLLQKWVELYWRDLPDHLSCCRRSLLGPNSKCDDRQLLQWPGL